MSTKAGSTQLTGKGTKFLTQVTPGSLISIRGESRDGEGARVESIQVRKGEGYNNQIREGKKGEKKKE